MREIGAIQQNFELPSIFLQLPSFTFARLLQIIFFMCLFLSGFKVKMHHIIELLRSNLDFEMCKVIQSKTGNYVYQIVKLFK